MGFSRKKSSPPVRRCFREFLKGKKYPRLGQGKNARAETPGPGVWSQVGDTVVVVATNKDGSVNGKTFLVSGILESATGPGGRDGYINFDDAREILRIPGNEASEIAVRVKSLGRVEEIARTFEAGLAWERKSKKGAALRSMYGRSSRLSPTSPT